MCKSLSFVIQNCDKNIDIGSLFDRKNMGFEDNFKGTLLEKWGEKRGLKRGDRDAVFDSLQTE